jgi:hypothetical protein
MSRPILGVARDFFLIPLLSSPHRAGFPWRRMLKPALLPGASALTTTGASALVDPMKLGTVMPLTRGR